MSKIAKDLLTYGQPLINISNPYSAINFAEHLWQNVWGQLEHKILRRRTFPHLWQLILCFDAFPQSKSSWSFDWDLVLSSLSLWSNEVFKEEFALALSWKIDDLCGESNEFKVGLSEWSTLPTAIGYLIKVWLLKITLFC